MVSGPGRDSPVFQSLRDLLPTRRDPLYGSLSTSNAPRLASNTSGSLKSTELLSTWRLTALTIVIAGAQLVWALEISQGTAFLVSLSLSKSMTALVWLAGPLSGFLAQPLIGAWSDTSRSRFRRRKYIVGSALFTLAALLVLAFAKEVAGLIVDSLDWNIEGSWDPKRATAVRRMSLIVAVPAFIVLDFSLNALQAATRALILDVARHGQLINGNAWQGRMTHAANIVAFLLGTSDLAQTAALDWISGGQFTRLCVILAILLTASTVITVTVTKEEEALPLVEEQVDTAWSRFTGAFGDIRRALSTLPRPMRRICWAQLAAYNGYFAFLFYAAFYVAEMYRREHSELPDSSDFPIRVGSQAMLSFAIVALAAGTVLPLLETVGWTDCAHQRHWLIRRLLSLFTPRNMWTVSQLLLGALLLAIFWIRDCAQATTVVALAGISWAIACWAPFSLVMEIIAETEPLDENNEPDKGQDRVSVAAAPPLAPLSASTRRDSGSGWPSSPNSARSRVVAALAECAPLIPRRPRRPGGAAILGIHNVAIVAPQFVTAIVASIIFSATDEGGKHSTITALRYLFAYGGVMSIISALLTRAVPPTLQEQLFRDQLREPDLDESVSSASSLSGQ